MDFLGTIEDDMILLHGLQAARLSPSRYASSDGKTAAVSGVLLSWSGFPETAPHGQGPSTIAISILAGYAVTPYLAVTR
jgi:hypothetical protein